MIRAHEPARTAQLVMLASTSLLRRLIASSLTKEEMDEVYDAEMDRIKTIPFDELALLLIEEMTPDEFIARA